MRVITGRSAWTVAVLAALCGFGAGAQEGFAGRLAKANDLLADGRFEDALTAYRDLQTDDPESPLLYYNLGCAHYDQAMRQAEIPAPEDAAASLREAKEAFAKVANTPDEDLRRRARFNAANAAAQLALQTAAAKEHEESVQALEESVAQYEDLLRLYPNHEGARRNLDYMRYVLKRSLQNPPEQQQQQQGEQSEEGEQSDEEQDGEEQEPQEGQQEQQGEDEQEEQQEEESEQQQGNEDEQDQEEQQQQGEGDEEEEQEQQQAQAQESDEPLDPDERQNLEAILQSLEDMDNREVYDTVNDRRTVRMGTDWW